MRGTLRADLHTHPLGDRYYCSYTAPRVPAGRDADDIAEFLAAAASRGVDVVAVTDHDCAGSGWLAKRAAEEAGLPLLVAPGTEVTTVWRGWRFHVLAYGVREDLPPNVLAPWEAVEEIHARSGAAVLAHPAREGPLTGPVLERCLDAGLDGVEVRNRRSGDFDASPWLGRASRWRGRPVLQTAGSDWHFWPELPFLTPGGFSAEIPAARLVAAGLISAEEAEAALARRSKERRKELRGRGGRGEPLARRLRRPLGQASRRDWDGKFCFGGLI
jgi:predicted metal-dependent phosphoesterase TrpH